MKPNESQLINRPLNRGNSSPEETALYIPHSGGILAVADAIVRYDGDLGFVPDYLLGGENPEAIKRDLRDVFLEHLDRDFDHMLFAHGDPWVGGANSPLKNYLSTHINGKDAWSAGQINQGKEIEQETLIRG